MVFAAEEEEVDGKEGMAGGGGEEAFEGGYGGVGVVEAVGGVVEEVEFGTVEEQLLEGACERD